MPWTARLIDGPTTCHNCHTCNWAQKTSGYTWQVPRINFQANLHGFCHRTAMPSSAAARASPLPHGHAP